MKNEPDSNKAEHEYVYGEDSAITTSLFSTRTAEKEAAFFLPYLQPGMTILDCGCGSGSTTIGLAKAVEPGQVTGVDISEVEVERARERAVESNVASISFEVANVYHLEFLDNSFDALFGHNVLEHIPDLKRALQEMYRVLKPGGIIGLRNMDWGGRLFGPHNEHMARFWSIGETYLTSAGGHTRLSQNLGTLLREIGFAEVKMSASYDQFNEPETRRIIAKINIDLVSEPAHVKSLTSGKLFTIEDLEAIKVAFLAWQETPGAFVATSECEAIGRKPE